MLSSQELHALAGVHAFLRNGYISSFFRKGKKKDVEPCVKNERLPQLFLEFGLVTKTTDDVIAILKNLYAVFIERSED